MADNGGQGARDQVDEALAGLERDGIQHVRFELPDMHGSARSKQVPIEPVRGLRPGRRQHVRVASSPSTAPPTVIPGTLYNEEVKYKDQTLRPDLSTPGDGAVAGMAWRRSSATPSGRTARRCTRRPAMSPVVCWRGAAALGFGIQSAHEYEFYVLDSETHQPLFGGVHIFNNLRNDHIPAIRDVVDGPARGRHSHADGECRSTRPPSTSWSTAMPRGMAGIDKRVHLQERGQGGRPARGPDCHLHGQAVCGLGGLRLPLPHQPARDRERAERLLRPG